MNLREVECIGERPKHEREPGDGAIRVRHEHAAFLERRLSLDEGEVIRVDLGDEERDVRIHPMGGGVRKDLNFGARGVGLDFPRDVGWERAERGDDARTNEGLDVDRLELHVRDVCVERQVLEAPELSEAPADLSLGRAEGRDLERRMVLEQANEPLTDVPRRSEDGYRDFRHSGLPPSK